MKNRFYKTTTGKKSATFVLGDVAYTSSTTYDAFVTAAPTATDGTFGVFREDTGALVTGASFATGVAGLGTTSTLINFFIAQVNNGIVRKSQSFSNPQILQRKFTPYTAPVRQQTFLGWDYSAGSLNLSTVTASQQFSFTTIETTPANEPAVRRPFSYLTTTASTQVEITYNALLALVQDVNNTGPYEIPSRYQDPCVASADLVYGGNATLTAFTGTGSMVLTKGSKTITISGGTQTNGVAGDYLVINNTLSQASTSFNKAAAVVTIADNVLYRVTAATTTSLTLDRPYTGETQTIAVGDWVTATQWVKRITNANFIAGTNVLGIKFTSKEFFTTFKIGIQEALASSTITYTTPFVAGRGIGVLVKDAEKQGYVFGGVATYNKAFPEDFGQPNYITNLSRAYANLELTLVKDQASIAQPITTQTEYSYINIWAPYVTGSANPDGTLVDVESYTTIAANVSAAFPTVNNVAAGDVPVPSAAAASAIVKVVTVLRPTVA